MEGLLRLQQQRLLLLDKQPRYLGCRAASSPQGFRPPQASTRKIKKGTGSSRLDGGQFSKKQLEKVSEASFGSEATDTQSNSMAPIPVVESNLSERKSEIPRSFEERLEVVRRSAQEAKKREEEKIYGPIDYDASSPKQDTKSFSFPMKVGVGLGVVVFGLIFAFGDILPSGVVDTPKKAAPDTMSVEELSKLQGQLQGFEAILKVHPDDLDALEGAAVTHIQLGDFSKSETELLQLIERRPDDVEALRLLGEVQFSLGDYVKSASSYQKALKASPRQNIILLKGLVQALSSQGKQNEAVETLIAARDASMSTENGAADADRTQSSKDADQSSPVQLELLLGKTYADWGGHVNDAIAVYDSIIMSYPNDFRGYLAKAVLLKEQGQKGEAERMLIQARFLAPEKLKPLVDRYVKQ